MRSDVILPMTDECMQQIVSREKPTYEFCHYRLNASVRRVWFYLKVPLSHISYVCNVDLVHTHLPGDPPLPEDGRGNKEFNERHPNWASNGYAYRICSVRRLQSPVSLEMLKKVYGIGIAPRGMIYTPVKLPHEMPLDGQELLWCNMEDHSMVNPLEETGVDSEVKSMCKVCGTLLFMEFRSQSFTILIELRYRV
ncbi:hypothetical protein DAEQUDRAFT_676010 [Daedalea quercina L-15889]|uniref:Uncharacterized protein n=1 Tax=Daedalea quercina L-15889 TaxID=1314783 RepID=A0A165MMS1_9APHY|nr:hypothetical protein DAEQUDRAFT_676010 [Daedalea quercina L-15889]